MSKFHINKNGVPSPCKATKGKCPLGGESGSENHFDNMEDAQKFAQETLEKENGVLAGMPSENNVEMFNKDDLDEMPDKAISFTHNGQEVKGRIIKTDYVGEHSADNVITVRDDKNNVMKVKSGEMYNPVIDFDNKEEKVSPDGTNFNSDDLEDMEGRSVVVEHKDWEKVEGKIVGTSLAGEHSPENELRIEDKDGKSHFIKSKDMKYININW